MTKNKSSRIRRFFKWFPILCKNIFSIYILIAILGTTIIMPNIYTVLQREYCKDYWILLIGAICLGGVMIIISHFCLKKSTIKSHKKDKIKMFLILSSIVLLLLQLFVVAGKFFIAGWDVNRIMFTTNIDDYYFSIYPNNLFLKSLAAHSTNIINHIPGLTEFTQSKINTLYPNSQLAANLDNYVTAEYINYGLFVVLNIVLTNISVLFILLVIKKFFNNNIITICVYIFTALFIGLIPWILVPYSDIYSLFFISAIMYSYVCIKKPQVKIPIIAFLTLIGYFIKPTVIFLLFAIVVVELCIYLSTFKNKKHTKYNLRTLKTGIHTHKNKILTCVFVLLAISITIGLKAIVINNTSININHDKEYGITHFLMLGANIERLGFYSDDDITISDSCPDQESRRQKNIEEYKNRITKMGLIGTIEHRFKKMLTNYGDGTFAWSMDGGANFSILNIGNNSVVNWFYNNYHYLAQLMWFFILIGCFLIFFIKKHHKVIYIGAISILWLSIFLMIFECGSRYLVLYLPVFIVLSTFGWVNIIKWVLKKWK